MECCCPIPIQAGMEVVLERAESAIDTARRELKTLCGRWSMAKPSVKELARFDLCAALVRRLEIAKQELAELTDLIELK
jgi:hypothetical protein